MIIQSGARLEFAVGAKLVVNGELQLWGRADRPVTFTSQMANPVAGNWVGVELNNTTQPYNWKHVIVEYARTGISVKPDVTLNLIDSQLRNNRTGVFFDGGSKGKVESSYIVDNTTAGIDIGA